MSPSCFVCVLRPLVYFTYFSYGFVDVKCPHSSKAADRPMVLRNVRRWCLTFILHFVLTLMISFTLYLNVVVEEFDYFVILTVSELVSIELGLLRLMGENIGWKQRLNELKLMLCIWNYAGTFRDKRNHSMLTTRSSVSMVAVMVILNAFSASYYLFKDISYMTFFNMFTRFSGGVLITATYTYSRYEFFFYLQFFKWTFEQVEREVGTRLASSNKLGVIYCNPKFPKESPFARKLRKLRKLYTAILYSFCRMKIMRRSYVIAVILIYHFLLIIITFLAFIVLRGEMEFHTGHYFYLVKNCGFFLHLGSIFLMCDEMQSGLQHLLTIMFRIPLNTLSPEESREVELMTKLLEWEQPIDSSRDMPVYKMNLLLNIIVNIITNAMVVIQMYFLFKKGS